MFDDLIENKNQQGGNTDKRDSSKKMPVVNSFGVKNKGEEKSSLARFTVDSDNFRKTSQKFEKKISDLRVKGKKRGKRYSLVGLSLSFIIFIVVVFFGYKIFGQVNSISQTVGEPNSNNLLVENIDPDNRCQHDSCCLASLKKIKKNNYIESKEGSDCESGFVKSQLNCENSMTWCETDIIMDTGASETEEGLEMQDGIEKNDDNTENINNQRKVDNFNQDPLFDADGDGLSYEEEIEYGTKHDNPDTDGDGYSDGDEVRNGYNPNGEGYLYL